MKYKVGDVVGYLPTGQLAWIVGSKEDPFYMVAFRKYQIINKPNDYTIIFYHKNEDRWSGTMDVPELHLETSTFNGEAHLLGHDNIAIVHHAHELVDICKGFRVKVRFKPGSESNNIYGNIVAGELVTGDDSYSCQQTFTIKEGTTTFNNTIETNVAMLTNAGCKSIYKISDENADNLKTQGFLTTDIESISRIA